MKPLARHHSLSPLWMMLFLTAINLVSAPYISSAITVGEKRYGGIVFYMDKSGEHRLVAAKENIAGHSRGMTAEEFTWHNAKAACNTYESNGYHGWKMPNAWQLSQLYLQRNLVSGFNDNFYWSSSRENNENARYIYFYSGEQNHEVKFASGRVRPVREF